MTICLQFVYNLVTICLQFVSVFSWFCLSFVTTKTKQNKDKLQIVYKNKTKQRQMTNCLQIVYNLSFVFVLFCFCCDKIQTKPRKNQDKLKTNCRQIVICLCVQPGHTSPYPPRLHTKTKENLSTICLRFFLLLSHFCHNKKRKIFVVCQKCQSILGKTKTND